MIEGKKATSPSKLFAQLMENVEVSIEDADKKLIDEYGIPVIWDCAKSTMQTQLRMIGLSGKEQMRWYSLEKELMHWLRLVYTDLTEEEIIEKWGPPDDADGRTAEELDAKTEPLHK
jgi:hypothetical protein